MCFSCGEKAKTRMCPKTRWVQDVKRSKNKAGSSILAEIMETVMEKSALQQCGRTGRGVIWSRVDFQTQLKMNQL